MIIREVLKLVIVLLKGVFSIIPNIPPLPDEFAQMMEWFVDVVRSVIGFINAIFPLQLALNLVAFVLVVRNVKILKNTMMWFVKKIPFLGIK